MQQTEHLKLNLIEGGDPVDWEVMNENAEKLEAAVTQTQAELSEGLAAVAETLEQGGHLARIAWGYYTGNGTYGKTNPVKLTFDFSPRFLVVGSKENSSTKFDKLMYPHPYGVMGNEGTAANLTWGTNSISWYNTDSAARQLNVSGTKYYYVALGNAGG